MKALVHSVRIAPKKANLIARMVRGLSVPVAMEQLRRTNKKAARIVEVLLRSAVANASHNDKQDAQMMVIKTIVVNQGQAYHRGMPMARGRQRPYRKFLSHITLTLGFAEDESSEEKTQKTQTTQKTQKNEKKGEGTASKTAATKVKTPRASSKTKKDSISATSSSASSKSSASSAS